MRTIISIVMLLSLNLMTGMSQTRTVGLMQNDTALTFEGYTLFAPKQNSMTYLINNEGRKINEWTASTYPPGQSVYLLENGHLLRTCMTPGQLGTGGGEGGRVEEYDWNDSLVWSLDFSTSTYMQHHDVHILPNGNLLMLVVEKKTYAQVLAAGFDPSKLQSEVSQKGFMLPDYVVEIQPTYPAGGTVVWEWHVWDHLVQDYDATKLNYGVPSAHPELIDCDGDKRLLPIFWNHMNSIDYNAEFDQIVVSVRGNSEAWIIDHSTTTAQAAGHTGGTRGKGGDLLYRWGNPLTYGAGTISNRKYFEQHDVEWIPDGYPGAGDLTCYNNGLGRNPNYSTVDEITPPVDTNGNYTIVTGSAFGPVNFTWNYTATPPASLFSNNISGAQRLPNGNTIICEGGHGDFREVTAAGLLVWRYLNPVTNTGILMQGVTPPVNPVRTDETMNSVFRVYRYAPDYPAFAGRNLTPGDYVETYSKIGMVNISADTFAMGDHYGFVDPAHPSDEIPVHQVKVDNYQISPYELTNQEFCIFLNEMTDDGLVTVTDSSVYITGNTGKICDVGPSGVFSRIQWSGSAFSVTSGKSDHPMTGIRWQGAVAYCNWLSGIAGYTPCYNLETGACDFSQNGYRLPTEAEWEYAARGGHKNPYYNYQNGNTIEVNQVNLPNSGDPYESGAYPYTTPAGFYDGALKQKTVYSWPGSATTYQTGNGVNGFGLYDMQGNAWELINDWYGQNYYSISPYDNPTGPLTGTVMPDGNPYRGMRGGNWYNGLTTNGVNDGHSRVSNRNPSYYRGPQDPNHPWYHIGFRIARSYHAPDELNLNNINIINGEDTCFAATQTVGLAGNGTTFWVQSGGSVNIIAGKNILLLAGVHVYTGGYFHGSIADSGQYCLSASSFAPVITTGTGLSAVGKPGLKFRVYPNPTTGAFTIEKTGASPAETIRATVTNVQGATVISRDLSGSASYSLSLENFANGVYFLKLTSSGDNETLKIVKRD